MSPRGCLAQGPQGEGTATKQQQSAAFLFPAGFSHSLFAPRQETDTCMNESLACVPTAKQRFSQQKPREGTSQIPSPYACSPTVATVVGAA